MAAGSCLTNATGLTEFDGLDSVDLMARLIYSEASTQSNEGKRGVYYTVVNRKAKNSTEFGGNTVAGVVLKANQFSGMTTNNARCPDTSSTAWADSLSVASSGGTNPIGTCLWFNTNTLFANRTKTVNKVEQYTFDGTNYRDVVEKKVIGDHTFFRVSGY